MSPRKSDPEQSVRDRAEELIPAIIAAAPRIDADRELPADLLESLFAAGMFRLLLPRALNGVEMHPGALFELMETIAAADGSVAWCLAQAAGCSMAAAYLEPAAARHVFDDPRALLAWGPGQGECLSGTWLGSTQHPLYFYGRLHGQNPSSYFITPTQWV